MSQSYLSHKLINTSPFYSDPGISELQTKTATTDHANTDDNVTMEVCNKEGKCCTTILDDPAVNDREKGNIDKFAGASLLGDCFGLSFNGDLTATLTKDNSDGWFVEWAKIKFDDSRSYTCNFNTFLDNSGKYSNSMTVNCDKGNKEIFIVQNSYGINDNDWAERFLQ